jgi:hypothetical protein
MARLQILTLSVLLFAGIGNADTLRMDAAVTGGDNSRPSRGMTATCVESRFGMPQAKLAAVGDPPITRWEYMDFVVFFEYDRVIHAVKKHSASN